MKLKKAFVGIAMTLFLATVMACPQSASAANTASIIINNTVYNNPSLPMPQNINGRVYVPLRLVGEGLNYRVEWNSAYRTVLINSYIDDVNTASTNSSSLQIYIHGQKLAVDNTTGIPFINSSGYTMVPVRVVAEKLGTTVRWESSTQTVIITSLGGASLGTVVPYIPDIGGGTSEVELPNYNKEPSKASEITLAGDSYCTLEQMKRYLSNQESRVRQLKGSNFVPFPSGIAEYYYNIGRKYNIRGDVALAQALLETGFFQYGNEVQPWQNNYCGLGATGNKTGEKEMEAYKKSLVNKNKAFLQLDIHGWCFDCVATGVEAHIQHIYSYVSANPLPAGCELLDGRMAHANRGKAIYLTDLNGKWAVPGNDYGEKIYSQILLPMMCS